MGFTEKSVPRVKPKAKVKTKPKKQGSKTGASAVYRGRQARTGNSLALRFDRALFQSHPEFNGEVEARVIGKGRMLVTAEVGKANEEDPVLSSFMSFLSADMERSPEHIRPLDSSLMKRIAKLVQGVEVTGDEALGDEATI
jgi:hypothetical protein